MENNETNSFRKWRKGKKIQYQRFGEIGIGKYIAYVENKGDVWIMVEDEGGNMKALDKNQAFEIDENIKKMEAKRLRIIEKVIEYNKSVEEYEGNIKPKLIGNRDIFKNNY